MTKWPIFQRSMEPHDGIEELPDPPPWRSFPTPEPQEEISLGGLDEREERRGKNHDVTEDEIELVNAALYLRRPLLITGKPGIGKSSLAFAVAYQLKLGPVLSWPITTRSTLQQGLYTYDAIGRLWEANRVRAYNGLEESDNDGAPEPSIGKYVRLGPLGTALLPSRRPKVLLVDEIDKSDIDLPNDLLNVFEEGKFEISELTRLEDANQQVEVTTSRGTKATVSHGLVACHAFPFVILTSNGEREFPGPFLRRCIRLEMRWPDDSVALTEKLTRIVERHLYARLEPFDREAVNRLIEQFISARESGDLAADQLLNAVFLACNGIGLNKKALLLETLLRPLSR